MKPKRNAFTLIELLIVVSIIGVLAAVIGAQYSLALHKADKAACQQTLRTLFSAIQSYKIDYNHFPPADGLADEVPHPDQTAFGCGPAANGYWSGVSKLLVQFNYCSEETLYCPALKRRYKHRIPAWPSCSGSAFAGKEVPQWRYLRFAYNNAATDVGGYEGGENNIEKSGEQDVWLIRCLHLDTAQFDRERAIAFPFRVKADEKNPNKTWWGEFELTLQGTIRLRPVQLR